MRCGAAALTPAKQPVDARDSLSSTVSDRRPTRTSFDSRRWRRDGDRVRRENATSCLMTATTSKEVVADGCKQKPRRSDGQRTSTCRRVAWTGLSDFDFVVDSVVNVSSSSFKDRRVLETKAIPQRNADTPKNITVFHPNKGNNVGYVGYQKIYHMRYLEITSGVYME